MASLATARRLLQQVVPGITGSSSATTVSNATTFSHATVKMTALPTSNPSVAGALWNDSGTVKVSAG